MKRACAAAALLLAACSAPQDPECHVAQAKGDTYVGPGDVTIRASLFLVCQIPNVPVPDRPLRPVKDVEVEVLDPDNTRVAAKATAPVRDGDFTQFFVSTDVTFVLDRPGPWTVIARFEPSLGRSQQIIRLLNVRTDAGVRELPTAFPLFCGAYGLTASGAPVCASDNGLLIGAQTIPGTHFAIDGDAIWALEAKGAADRLKRYEPGDAGEYGQTHRFEVSTAGPNDVQFAAGGGAAFLFHNAFNTQGVERLDPGPDGGGTRTVLSLGDTRFPLGVSPSAERTMVLARGTDGAGALISFRPDGGSDLTSAAATGGSVSYGDGLLWQVRGVNAVGVNAEPEGPLMGFDGTGDSVRTGTVDVQANHDGFSVGRLSPFVPVVRVAANSGATEAVLPVFEQGELRLEAFDAGPGYFEVSSATRRHAFARSIDGKTLKVFDR